VARFTSSARISCEKIGPGWNADDVGGEHVAGELYAVKIQTQELREHLSERGLADAGQVFDQKVPAREQAGERETDLALLAEDDFPRLLDDALNERRGHPMRECRKTVC